MVFTVLFVRLMERVPVIMLRHTRCNIVIYSAKWKAGYLFLVHPVYIIKVHGTMNIKKIFVSFIAYFHVKKKAAALFDDNLLCFSPGICHVVPSLMEHVHITLYAIGIYVRWCRLSISFPSFCIVVYFIL
jgi:hypothetical protein